jgi:hypothetical protein
MIRVLPINASGSPTRIKEFENIVTNKEPWNLEGKKKLILSLPKETYMPGLSRHNVCDGGWCGEGELKSLPFTRFCILSIFNVGR